MWGKRKEITHKAVNMFAEGLKSVNTKTYCEMNVVLYSQYQHMLTKKHHDQHLTSL